MCICMCVCVMDQGVTMEVVIPVSSVRTETMRLKGPLPAIVSAATMNKYVVYGIRSSTVILVVFEENSKVFPATSAVRLMR